MAPITRFQADDITSALFRLSANELLKACRSKQLSPLDVTAAVLAHIERRAPVNRHTTGHRAGHRSDVSLQYR